MSNLVNKTLNHHMDWLKTHGENIYKWNLDYLQHDLKDGNADSLLQIVQSLKGLAYYFGIYGCVVLSNGNRNGWKDVACSLDLHSYAIRIKLAVLEKRPNDCVSDLTNDASCIAGLCCVSTKWRPFAFETLSRIEEDDALIDRTFWDSRAFEPFVIKCVQRLENRMDDATICQPYQDVLVNWDDNTLLNSSLVNVCDFHAQRIEDNNPNHQAEFKYSPFDLLPCEYILVTQIRAACGLSTPRIAHELVTWSDFEDWTSDPFPYEEHELVHMVKSNTMISDLIN